eukprot:TRINITY_DN159_c0_g1_i2.p1 TRINITY_DN159_c0_g1~~TRINITY_DN159_c0_g1_i2.p1  ORF type:complete len:468 (+),score=129.60 TRINITY_DN159_c0_g1_i2:930-2333(+)
MEDAKSRDLPAAPSSAATTAATSAARRRAASSASVPPSRPVCVTGATGFIGSHIVRELTDRGIPCRAATRDAGAAESSAAFLAKLVQMYEGQAGAKPAAAGDGDSDSSSGAAVIEDKGKARADGASAGVAGADIPAIPAELERFRHLLLMHNPASGAVVEIVHGDPADRESLETAFRGCESVIHCATNVSLDGPDGVTTIIQPAVFGTQNALEAAVKCGVKRFVHISSVAAVSPGDGGKSGRGTNAERAALTEDDWFEGTSETHGTTNPYAVGKALSERLLEQYRDRIDVVIAICPSLVLGPILTAAHAETSPKVIRTVLTPSTLGLPRLSFAIVDVRDVAQASVDCAIGVHGEPGQRYILSNGSWWLLEMAEALRPWYADVPTRRMWDTIAYAGSALGRTGVTVGFLRRKLGFIEYYSGKRAVKELGIKYRDGVKTMVDTAQSLVELGIIDDMEAPTDTKWEDDRS